MYCTGVLLRSCIPFSRCSALSWTDSFLFKSQFFSRNLSETFFSLSSLLPCQSMTWASKLILFDSQRIFFSLMQSESVGFFGSFKPIIAESLLRVLINSSEQSMMIQRHMSGIRYHVVIPKGELGCLPCLLGSIVFDFRLDSSHHFHRTCLVCAKYATFRER